MSAPTKPSVEAAATEPPTLPQQRPVSQVRPAEQGGWVTGLWLFPGAPLAAIGAGESLRLVLTIDGRSAFAVTLLALLTAGGMTATLCARRP